MKSRTRDRDMLSGSLWDKILLFALPLAATGILQQLFNAADIAVVGRFTGELGTAAMAAVGANGPIVGLVVNTFVGISLGTNVVIANAAGRGEDEEIGKAVHTSVLLAVLAGVVVAVLGQFLAQPVLSSQHVPDDVLDMAILYFRIYLGGAPVILLYNFESAIFRSVGNTKTPLCALALSGVLNVLLNVVFVVGFRMTAGGVALATVISNLVSASILMAVLIRGGGPVSLRFSELRLDGRVLGRILRIGIPAGLQSAVFAVANIILQGAINQLDKVVMAASSAAFNIEVMAYHVLNSFSQACTTFVGQNYGGGKLDRCKRTVGVCYLEGVIATATAAATILLIGRQLLALFNPDPAVVEYGYLRLVVVFVAYIFTLTYETAAGYLRGFGNSLVPALLTILGICVVRISWIYLVFPQYKSFFTIVVSIPISLAITAVLEVTALLCTRPAARVLARQEQEAQPMEP